jgi:hypothetical protein
MMTPKLDWRAPAVVYEEAERERLAMTGLSYLGNLGRPSREKFIAALFGLGYEQHVGPCRLAALSDAPESPDAEFFDLNGHGGQHAFQTVEVLDPGRRRGDEYHDIEAAHAEGKQMVIHDDGPERGNAHGLDWITVEVAKKARKYGASEGLHLVVYVNFRVYLQHADLVARTAPYTARFASIWAVVFSAEWRVATLHPSPHLGVIAGLGSISIPNVAGST